MTPRRDATAARASRRLMSTTAWAVRGSLVAAVAGALVRQGGFLAAPFVLQFVVDDGIAAGDATATALWCALVAVAAILQFAGMCVWDHFANLADARAGVLLRTRVRAGALAQDDATSEGAGDILVRAGRDVDVVRVWVHGLPTWAVIGVTVAVLVPGFAALDPWLLLVALATVPCLVVLSVVYPRRFERAAAHAADAQGARADVVDHIIRSAVAVRGAGAEDAVIAHHDAVSAEVTARTVRASGVLARWTALGEGVPAVATAVGLLVGVFAVADGRLSVGGLVTFAGWMATVGIAVQVGLLRWTQSVDARVGARRLGPLLSAVPSPAGPSARVGELVLRGAVAVPGATPVDLELTAGRLVAVTGPTGSGKSALLRVIAGLRRPAAGTVAADGTAVAAPVAGVHLVPQRPLVLSGTVRDNLALGAASGDEVADELAYRAALAAVGLDEELSGRAADPLELVVGEGGAALSGGQTQRLALARALVARPAVLLLDDVTSAVDRVTGRRLIEAVRAAATDRIVVVAGHGEVVEAADRVVRLHERTGASR